MENRELTIKGRDNSTKKQKTTKMILYWLPMTEKLTLKKTKHSNGLYNLKLLQIRHKTFKTRYNQ